MLTYCVPEDMLGYICVRMQETERLCLLQIHILKPNLQGDGNWRWATGRWIDHTGGAPMSEINAPSTLWGHKEKMVVSKAESGPSADTESAGTLSWTSQPSELWD